MELTELTNRASDLRPRGVLGAELRLTLIEEHTAVLERDEVVHSTGASQALTVQVWLDGDRSGTATGAPDAYDAVVERALANAESGPPQDGPVQRQDREIGGLGIFDPRRANISETHRADVLKSARQSVLAADELEPGSFSYRDEQVTRRFASSRGVALQETGTRFVVQGSATATAPDGDFVLNERIASRRFSSVATLPLGEFLARRARVVRQPGEGLPEGPVRVVLTPRATAQLFTHLGPGFTAARIAEGAFFLTPGQALDPRLHLVDDGLLAGGLTTRAFDDRGVSPVALTLLRDGRLDGRFVTVAEARTHSVRPSGHLMNGELGPSNLVLKSGTRSVNALLAELQGPSFRVDDLPDCSGVDLATGEASLVVHGEVMEANKAVGSMRHVRIAGQLTEVLGKLVEVCNDTDRWGAMDAPALITQGWTLSTAR
ncbi:MAG: metallopeptidase TldD-related protein [Myxococcota bacterium]